jgi:DNA mismatch endonuclease, patch repair protein
MDWIFSRTVALRVRRESYGGVSPPLRGEHARTACRFPRGASPPSRENDRRKIRSWMSIERRAHSGRSTWIISVEESESKRLAKQPVRDTRLEKRVRAMLFAIGHRFTTRNRDLPGNPDVANRSRKWAVFVHGCFWHHHSGCRRATIPKSNREFWLEKFRANRDRDAEALRALRASGYKPILVWECEAEPLTKIHHRLNRMLVDRLPPKPSN